VATHDPLVALRLIYQMFSKLLSWIVLVEPSRVVYGRPGDGRGVDE
jgi:hypothetical protein